MTRTCCRFGPMHLLPLATTMVTALVIVSVEPLAIAQSSMSSERRQAQELLQRASRLVPQLSQLQQSSAGANVAGQQARSGDLNAALETVHRLKPQEQGMALGIVAFSVNHFMDEGTALRIVASIQDDQARDLGYLQLAQAEAKDGHYEKAFEIARRISTAHPERLVDTLDRIATSANPVDRQVSRAALDEALAVATRNQSSELFGAMVLNVAQGESETGDPLTATRILREFEPQIRKKTSDGQFAIEIARTGDFPTALNIAETIPEGNWRDTAYQIISWEQGKRGDVADALKTLNQIHDDNVRFNAVREFALRQADAGHTAMAFDLIDAIADRNRRVTCLSDLALQAAQKNDPAAIQASELAEKLLETSSGDVKANKSAEQVREFLSVTYALQHNFPKAIELVEQLAPEDRQWPLWNIANMLVAEGRSQEALALADGQQDPLAKLYALLGSAQGLLDRAQTSKRGD